MKFEKLAQNDVARKDFNKYVPKYLKRLGEKLGMEKGVRPQKGKFKITPIKSDFGGWILHSEYLVIKISPFTFSNKEYKNISVSMYSMSPKAKEVNNRVGFNNTKSLAYFVNNEKRAIKHLKCLLLEPKMTRLIEKYDLSPKERSKLLNTKNDSEFSTLYENLDLYLKKLFKFYLMCYNYRVHSVINTRYNQAQALKGKVVKRAERIGLYKRVSKVDPREHTLPVVKQKTFFKFAKPVSERDKEKRFGFYHMYDKKAQLLYRAASQTSTVIVYDVPYKEYKSVMKRAKKNKYAGQLELDSMKVINFVILSEK